MIELPVADAHERLRKPKWLKVIADFKPRGNVHTVIEIDSSKI